MVDLLFCDPQWRNEKENLELEFNAKIDDLIDEELCVNYRFWQE